MAVIYAFGDSITYGAWDIKRSGWMARLRQYLDDLQDKNPKYYGLFYNLGIPGETTSGLVKRFEIETAARERTRQEKMFILAFGANDAAFLRADNRFKVPKDEFEKNLKQVIENALLLTKKILLINILPVIEAKNSVPRNGKVRSNEYMQEYNAILDGLAKHYSLELIDAYSIFMEAGHEALLNNDDGLHPNEKGHQLLYEAIQPVVQKMIGWE